MRKEIFLQDQPSECPKNKPSHLEEMVSPDDGEIGKHVAEGLDLVGLVQEDVVGDLPEVGERHLVELVLLLRGDVVHLAQGDDQAPLDDGATLQLGPELPRLGRP